MQLLTVFYGCKSINRNTFLCESTLLQYNVLWSMVLHGYKNTAD